MKHFICFILLFSISSLIAQDVNLSQHWNAPTQFEVAKLASIDHLQAGIHYRNQWPEELNSFRTYAAHVTYPLLLQGLYDPQWGAVGIDFIGDASGLGGIYKQNQIKATFNYKASLSRKHFLSFGISGNGLWTILNTEHLTSGVQYQNGAYQAGSPLGETFQHTNSSAFFIDAGLRFQNKTEDHENWFVAASIYNLSKTPYGFNQKNGYPKRISISAGYTLIETFYVKVQPDLLYQSQSTSTLTVIGSNFYYKLSDPRKRDARESLIGGGFHSRLKHDLIISAEIKQENFTAGVSYDFHSNKNSLRPTSSFELFLSYNIAVTPKSRKKRVKKETLITEEPSLVKEVIINTTETKQEEELNDDKTTMTMVELKLLDSTFNINSADTEILFKNLDDTLNQTYEVSYNKDSTSFISYLSKNTNYAITIKREGFYNKTLKFNTGKRDSLEIPNKLKVIVLGEVLVLNKVHFKSGVDELDPSSEDELTSLVSFLTEYPNIRAEISGHTDDLGSAELNQLLSRKRAEAIVTYLTYKGIDNHRLVAKGFGESNPIVPNDSNENRAKNRRVELKIIGK